MRSSPPCSERSDIPHATVRVDSVSFAVFPSRMTRGIELLLPNRLTGRENPNGLPAQGVALVRSP